MERPRTSPPVYKQLEWCCFGVCNLLLSSQCPPPEILELSTTHPRVFCKIFFHMPATGVSQYCWTRGKYNYHRQMCYTEGYKKGTITVEGLNMCYLFKFSYGYPYFTDKKTKTRQKLVTRLFEVAQLARQLDHESRGSNSTPHDHSPGCRR